MKLIGIYEMLGKKPIWIISITLFTFLNVVIFGGRDFFEGVPYNISRASQYGDNALIIAFLIACAILQSTSYAPKIFNSWRAQYLLAAGCFFVGFVMNLFAKVTSTMGVQVVDIYHNVFIIPAFLFLFITMLPVTFSYGSRKQKITTIICFAVWAVFLVLDIYEGRLEQIAWIKTHGFLCLPKL